MSVRTNWCRNPAAVDPISAGFATYGAGTGETGTTSVVGPDEDGPNVGGRVLGYARRTITAPKTAGSTGWQATAAPTWAEVSGGAGDTYTVSVWLRYTGPDSGRPVRFRGQFWHSGVSVNLVDTDGTTLVSGQWTRLSVTVTSAGTYSSLRWWAYQTFATGLEMQPGTYDATAVLIEKEPSLHPYYDGDTPDTPVTQHAWTGTPNASPSTRTSVDVTAELLTTDQPQPVQVLVSNLMPGEEFHVVGVSPTTGFEWAVPGGRGISEGTQVRLVDYRAPINAPVHYKVKLADADPITSNTITVPYQANGAMSDALIQSLDGRVSVPIKFWYDNRLPRDRGVRTSRFDVHNRRRPVTVLRPATDGSTAVQMRLSRTAGAALDRILSEGGAVCIRTNGKIRDLHPTDLAVITECSSQLWEGGGGASNDRVWDMGLVWIDDPEPSVVPTVWTVDYVDQLLGVTLGMTVDQVDAMFSDLTVNDVDATDWGSLA